jgi:glycerophosphoryl diester phosphodiesterase
LPRKNKRLLLLPVLCLALTFLFSPPPVAAETPDVFDLQAHRGGRGLRPENTLAAFAYALELGVTTLELDLAVTLDRVVVISHDPALSDRLVKGADGEFVPRQPRRFIREMSLAELETYTVGEINPRTSYAYAYPDQLAVPGQTIPTLAGLFDLVRSRGDEAVRFNIEIKTYPPFPEYSVEVREFAELVVAVIAEYGLEKRVTVQSFDWRALRVVRELAPELSIACLTVRDFSLDGQSYNLNSGRPGASAWLAGLDADGGNIAALVHAFGADIYSPYYKEVTAADIEAAHELGLRVIPWTVNNEQTMRSLIARGVDGLITDRPDLLKEVLEELSISY